MAKDLGLMALYEVDSQPVVDSYGAVLVFKDKEHVEATMEGLPVKILRLVKAARVRTKKEAKNG